MEKQYYAILTRDSEFNDEILDDEVLDGLSAHELDQSKSKILVKSTSYTEIYNKFQELKKIYPEIRANASDLGYTTESNMEICLVRISVMQNWETLKP